MTIIQAPAILPETEYTIDQNIEEFDKDVAKLDAAVRNLNTVENDHQLPNCDKKSHIVI